MKKREEIDDIDREILRILQINGRKTYREINSEIGVSIGTIHNRITSMKDRGIIKGIEVVISDDIIGYNLISIIRIQYNSIINGIIDKLHQKKNVCSIFENTGKFNLTLLCRFKDLTELGEFISQLYNDDKNIMELQQEIVVKEYYNKKNIRL